MRRFNASARAMVVSVALLTVWTAVGARPVGAAAAVPPTIQLVAPAVNATLSGMVDITVDIGQPDSAHPVNEVDFDLFGAFQTRQSIVATIDAGGCAPTCTVTRTFDTRTLVVPATALSVNQNLPDGRVDFEVTVRTAFGPTNRVDAYFVLDNGRPSVSLPDLGSFGSLDPPKWGGDASLQTDVSAVPNARTGAAIESLRVIVPNYPVIPLANKALPAPAGGSGPVTIDLSGVPKGYYIGYLAAIDETGLSSGLLRIAFTAGHYAVLATVPNGFYTDGGEVFVSPNWLDGRSGVFLTKLDVYVDGTLVGSENWGLGSITARPVSGKFSEGSHSVTVVATDNGGVVESATISVNAEIPVSAYWDIGTAWGGEKFSVLAQANSHSSLINSFTLADETGVLASFSGSAANGPVLTTTLVKPAGTYELSGTVVLTDGDSYVLHHTLVVGQRAASAAYVASSRRGAAVYINGLVKQLSGGVWIRSPYRTVYLQRLINGSWQNMLVRYTDQSGQLAVGFIQPRSYQYRLVVATTLPAIGPANAAASTVSPTTKQ